MNPTTVFYSILFIVGISFVIEQWLNYLNASHFDDPIPPQLADVYDAQAYRKSQNYKKVNYRFSLIKDAFFCVLTLVFFWLEGFAYVDSFARQFTDHPVLIALIFFSIIMIGSDILSLPFSYYHTFVIEEEFGFNKVSMGLFIKDKVLNWVMMLVIGGGLLAMIIWFYQWAGRSFWLYAWVVFTIFAIIVNMFYARLIVPLFNKQKPLYEGSLRAKIENYAAKTGFDLKNIYLIDGSKRSNRLFYGTALAQI